MRLPIELWTRRDRARTATPTGDTELAQAARVEDRLLTILAMVNGWLQFAETKNAGLVALNALTLTGILEYLAHVHHLPRMIFAGIMLTGIFLLLSLGVSLLSFLPRSDPRRLVPRRGKTPRETDNFFFFGDLYTYHPEQLVAAVAHEYEGIHDFEPSRHRSQLDLASQIIANSRITVGKNAYFRVATAFAIFALFAALTSALLALFPQK